MINAVYKNGVIVPVDPPPASWKDGQEVRVEEAGEPNEHQDAIDRWYQELQSLEPALQDPAEIERFQAIVANVRRKDRELARRQVGADRQRIVSSKGSFNRHRMPPLNVGGNRQRPRDQGSVTR